MPDMRLETDENIVESVWEPAADTRCIVCNRPSGGKAICGDQQCAEELAQG